MCLFLWGTGCKYSKGVNGFFFYYNFSSPSKLFFLHIYCYYPLNSLHIHQDMENRNWLLCLHYSIYYFKKKWACPYIYFLLFSLTIASKSGSLILGYNFWFHLSDLPYFLFYYLLLFYFTIFSLTIITCSCTYQTNPTHIK
jgi:hypothetical protein